MSGTHEAGVVIVGTIHVAPSRRARFDDLMEELQRHTRQEPGCMGFSSGTEAGSATGVLVQEEYVDRAALDAHQAQPHVATYAQALPDLLAEAVTFRIYEVSGRTTFTIAPHGPDEEAQ